jgi:hypothetical protein
MRNTRETPWWETGQWLIGFEDDDNDDGDNADDGDNNDEDNDDEGNEGGSNESSNSDQNVEGLKSALRKERRRAKDLDREVKTLKATKDKVDQQEQSELEKAREALKDSDTKTTRLATRLLDQSLATAIISAAEKAKFVDAEDAVLHISRDDLDFEQDPDDPSSVTVDKKSVEDAVKALAKKKPHLIGKAKEGEDEEGSRRTGSPGGQRRPSQKEQDDAALRAKYPALRN